MSLLPTVRKGTCVNQLLPKQSSWIASSSWNLTKSLIKFWAAQLAEKDALCTCKRVEGNAWHMAEVEEGTAFLRDGTFSRIVPDIFWAESTAWGSYKRGSGYSSSKFLPTDSFLIPCFQTEINNFPQKMLTILISSKTYLDNTKNLTRNFS